jgi:D-glycero-D-manno-heptose 1,7-bisphosphate phosphatase
MPAARPALFLDRDGVINVDQSYVFSREDFEWVDGAKAVIRRFNDMGW